MTDLESITVLMTCEAGDANVVSPEIARQQAKQKSGVGLFLKWFSSPSLVRPCINSVLKKSHISTSRRRGEHVPMFIKMLDHSQPLPKREMSKQSRGAGTPSGEDAHAPACPPCCGQAHVQNLRTSAWTSNSCVTTAQQRLRSSSFLLSFLLSF